LPGPPKKPSALKRLEGTVQPCRMNPYEPQLDPKKPDCILKALDNDLDESLAHLSPTAQKLWGTFADILYNMGVLTEADGPMLTELVETYAEIVDARQEIRNLGGIYYTSENRNKEIVHKVHPAVGVAADASRRFAQLAAQFGLTPAARMRVAAVMDKKANNEFEDI